MELSIATFEYNIDIEKLFKRRLIEAGAPDVALKSANGVCIARPKTETDMEACISAVCELILMDFSQFELSKIVNELPFALETKREILTQSIRSARSAAMRTPVKQALAKHFVESTNLIIEGFIRFRMRDTQLIWERCVDKAAEEQLIALEQRELNAILSEYVSLREAAIKEVSLIFPENGLCILTDDSNSRIEYTRESFDVLLSVLISLAPEIITIYDLSNGQSDDMLHSIINVFNSRVRVYVSALPPS